MVGLISRREETKMIEETAFIWGMEGFDEIYDSEYEFKKQLKLQLHLSSKKCNHGWVFWSLFDSSTNYSNIYSTIGRIMMQRVIEEIASRSQTWNTGYVVQFWVAEVDEEQQQHYLTTSDQPFAVSQLYKGLSLYRQRCEAHRYRVDEGAGEEELGAVGRVYRNKRPESSPDLRLYSTKEFPLRDSAAHAGLRSYYTLPIFDLLGNLCYGVIEALCFGDDYDMEMLSSLVWGLKNAELRTTHLKCWDRVGVHSEIEKMVELAVRVIPQLRMAQVWVPCRECSNANNNLSCFESAYSTCYGVLPYYDIRRYVEACELHNLQIAEYTITSAKTVTWSINKPCICRNICDLSISENPLVHYAQKARLSFSFTICVTSLYNSSDIYLVEFFLQFNGREDAVVGSFLQLLLSIMERELKSFDFAYKGHNGEELVAVEVTKENMLVSSKSSQSNEVRYETLKCKHGDVDDVSRLMVMEGFEVEYSLSDFMKYLQNPDLRCKKPSTEREAWVFWSEAKAGIYENEVINGKLSLVSDTIQEKIICLMREITSQWGCDSSAVAQFWAPKKDDMDRCYLETSGQPFAVSGLSKGLASLRKQFMGHKYYVDDAAKEEVLGPPGHVFLNGHPEFSPDLRLYSLTEFPLRNHAAHFSLTQYYALPVFKRSQQHICVGVLELLQSTDSDLPDDIGDAIVEANLMSSTHIFNQSSRGRCDLANNNAEGWESALTEMEEACQLFTEIPQVCAAEVWVLCNKCPTTLSCMERVCYAPEYGGSYLDSQMGEFKHVEKRKGITGMALASENMSCFSLNLCAFGLAENPHAHYAQAAGLDVCFVICLQSWHSGDLVYVVEFYLNQGPRKYDYFRSFLCLLLPLLKQKLTSFKVASGQQLGDKLIVEVINFSQVNELDAVELNQSDGVSITFKFVNYRDQKHSQDHKHDVQLALDDGVESVSIVAEAQHCSNSAANLNIKESANGTKSETGLNITREDVLSLSSLKRKDAAKELGVSESTFKRICRKHNIPRWPPNPFLCMRESANESGQDSQPNMDRLLNSSNLPPPDMPQTNPNSSQQIMTEPNVEMVLIFAKYESKTIKFKLRQTAGMEKLVSEVVMRLKLEVGSFEMEYLDETKEKILLTCDADLELCLESIAPEGKCYIQISSLKNPAVIGKPCTQIVPSPTQTTLSSSAGGYIHHFPSYFHRYILSIKNVVADGHCGYRVVANLLGFGEESWARVRQDLIDELRQNHQLYTSVFIKHGAVEEILQILTCFEERATDAHWFTLPEMGYLVASAYNVALVSLSTNMCSTFLPLRTIVPCNLRCICIGLVNNDHFVQVSLRDGHPVPPILAKWYECRYPVAADWSIVYTQQLMLYNIILGNNNVVRDTINLED